MGIGKPLVEGYYSGFYSKANKKKNERDRSNKRTSPYLLNVKGSSRVVDE